MEAGARPPCCVVHAQLKPYTSRAATAPIRATADTAIGMLERKAPFDGVGEADDLVAVPALLFTPLVPDAEDPLVEQLGHHGVG